MYNISLYDWASADSRSESYHNLYDRQDIRNFVWKKRSSNPRNKLRRTDQRSNALTRTAEIEYISFNAYCWKARDDEMVPTAETSSNESTSSEQTNREG